MRKPARPRICGIYAILNNLNGKVYVGQSVDIFLRWSNHLCNKDKSLIGAALRKHGPENFSFKIIHLCLRSNLNGEEVQWIKQFDCLAPQGYNLTKGGDNRGPVTESAREAISDKAKEYAKRHGREANDLRIWEFEHLDGRVFHGTEFDLRRIHMPEYADGKWCDTRALVEGKLEFLRGWFMQNNKPDLLVRRVGKFTHRYVHKDGREIHANYSEMSELAGVEHSNLRRLHTGKQKQCKGWQLAGLLEK